MLDHPPRPALHIRVSRSNPLRKMLRETGGFQASREPAPFPNLAMTTCINHAHHRGLKSTNLLLCKWRRSQGA